MSEIRNCPKCGAEVEGGAEAQQCPACHANLAAKTAPPREEAIEQAIDLIEWGPRFLLGNSEIDSQHQKLCALINDLHRALASHSYRENFIQEIIKNLVEYARQHFRYEEQLFKSTQYPGQKFHCEEHTRFVQQVGKLYSDYRESIVDLKSLLRFLVKWFISHVTQTDKGYQRYIQSK